MLASSVDRDVNGGPVGRKGLHQWFQTLNLSFTFYIYILELVDVFIILQLANNGIILWALVDISIVLQPAVHIIIIHLADVIISFSWLRHRHSWTALMAHASPRSYMTAWSSFGLLMPSSSFKWRTIWTSSTCPLEPKDAFMYTSQEVGE